MSKNETGWIIDRDYINKDDEDGHTCVGRRGLRDDNGLFVSSCIGEITVTDPVRFRLLDDDGEVYFGGKIARSWIDGDEDVAFHALQWGAHDSGCTELQYHYGDGEWKTL